MTLEDFFTLTEMKDGLTASARVKELVNVMQKEKDCVLKNVGDATRQWSTVASTIAATEDKDCLDLFIQLDGLSFIDRWLKDAQKFGNDASDSFAEESITALLHALEKLHINYEQSMSYGIWITVENLLSHSSFRVQERARALTSSWKQQGGDEAIPRASTDLDGEGGQTKSSTEDIDTCVEATNVEKHENPGAEMAPSTYSNVLLPGKVDDIQSHTVGEEKTLGHEVVKDLCPIMSKPIEGSLCNEGEYLQCRLTDTASIRTCTSVVSKQDGPVLDEISDNGKQMQEVASPSNKLDAIEMFPAPSTVDNAPESVSENDLQKDIDTKDNYCSKDLHIADLKAKMSKDESRMNADGSPHHGGSMVASQNQGHDCDINVLDDSGYADKFQKLEDSVTSFSREDSGSTNEEHSSDESVEVGNDTHVSETAIERDVVNNRMSEFELDDDMVDALEVARQVAIEVEREVVGRREPSCSSSEKNPDVNTRNPDSTQSVHEEGIQTPESSSKETSPMRGKLSVEEKDPDAEAENCKQPMESSQIPESGKEAEVKSQKGIVDFDLNEEVWSEEMDRPLNPTSTPVSIVSASRAAAAPGLPASPLQFEGAHGWKGSAATSAFRPASPRKTIESDKSLTISGSDNSSKQRHGFLDIDLNMAEGENDKTADLILGEDRLKLDLNRISDDGDAPSDWRMDERILLRNGHHNVSPSSSSSSMQPSLRNFDLNDQPFFSDSSELHPFFGNSSSQKLNAFGGPKSNDSVISIMGTRVEVNRKDFFPQASAFSNGRILEPALDVNLARSGGVLGIGSAVPYPHPHIFAYNRLTTGPTGNFSSVMYGPPAGPIPYMVDSRGAPVVPQLVDSVSAVPASYSQPPFAGGIFGMPPPGLNGPGPSRPSFDLNSGLMIERVNRDSGGLRQFFNPGQSRSLDEQLRSSLQPSSSIGVGKRKEPDGGWENYPFDHKHHHHPPWK